MAKFDTVRALTRRDISEPVANKLAEQGFKLGDIKKMDVASLTSILGDEAVAIDTLEKVGGKVSKEEAAKPKKAKGKGKAKTKGKGAEDDIAYLEGASDSGLDEGFELGHLARHLTTVSRTLAGPSHENG